jgi:rhodanese-related sulfurtransferase
MATRATQLIAEFGLPMISPETVKEWQQNESRTSYILDVRTATEFSTAHWQGAQHAPGGQLVQATDQYVAVRNARIILSDDVHLRAATTGMWLKGMGHDVYILDADARSGTGSLENVQLSPAHDLTSISDLIPYIADGGMLLDASPSDDYRKAHIDGAIWVTRSRLSRLDARTGARLMVTGQDDVLIDGVVSELKSLGYADVKFCPGTPGQWSAAGLYVVATENDPADNDCIDYLFFVHDRHDGNLDAARRYLEWETGLLEQLDAQERSVLNPQYR